jgi:hypothetical protein
MSSGDLWNGRGVGGFRCGGGRWSCRDLAAAAGCEHGMKRGGGNLHVRRFFAVWLCSRLVLAGLLG